MKRSCSYRLIASFYLLLLTSFLPCNALADKVFWWHSCEGANFGDDLSRVIIEKILGRTINYGSLDLQEEILLGAGSILHFARDGDIIWGSGFREDPMNEDRFHKIDVRAVRGPKTREFLIRKGIECPEIYGDPGILMGYLFPEFKQNSPIYDYIIIPNIGEMIAFQNYRHVVLPTSPWNEIVDKITKSRLVISSSLHGIIVAESYGIPARLLKMTWIESILKYQDYYESTGRPDFQYATSVQEALRMGGERPAIINIQPLLEAFPFDHFNH